MKTTDDPHLWHQTRTVRDSITAWSGRYGRGVSCFGYTARPHRRGQDSSSSLSEDPDAKERFDREARTISSLNHPNICTLHDVGHQNGVDYLVMEYLEGETLASRLSKGALSPDQVLKMELRSARGSKWLIVLASSIAI